MRIFPSRENVHEGRRYTLTERFKRLPLKNASIGVAANLDFEILGGNVADADQAFNAKGGIDLTSHGGATDSAILLPHLDTLQTEWAKSGIWAPTNQPHFAAHVAFPAITDCTFWAGFKLTNTPVLITDDDQVFFRYQNGTDTYIRCIYSIAGTDVDVSSGVTPVAGGEYRLWITMSSNRRPSFWINGVCVYDSDRTSALTAAANLIPYLGVLSATTATAKVLTCRTLECSIATGA